MMATLDRVRQLCVAAFNAGVIATQIDEGHMLKHLGIAASPEPAFPEIFEAWWAEAFK